MNEDALLVAVGATELVGGAPPEATVLELLVEEVADPRVAVVESLD